MADFKIPANLPEDLFSKEKAYYRKDITDRIAPASRKLLEEYSHIEPEDVDAHIYKTVSLSSLLCLSHHKQHQIISITPQLTTSHSEICSGTQPPIPV